MGMFSIPKEYEVRIYKSVYGCCGVSNSNIIAEIIGPDEKAIKDICLRVMSKLVEICQKTDLNTTPANPWK